MKYCSNRNCILVIILLLIAIFIFLQKSNLFEKNKIFSFKDYGKAQVFSPVNNELREFGEYEITEDGAEANIVAGGEEGLDPKEGGFIDNVKKFIKSLYTNEPEAQTPANIPPLLGPVNLPNSCGIYDREKLYVLAGETFDVNGSNGLFRNSNIWSTIDGENWVEIAKTTAMGEKWEIMPLVVNNTAYVFGGKYKKNAGLHDNSVYMSKNMIDFTYLGELPPTLREYDRSMVYFKNKFWFISSEESVGVWSSADAINWKQETKSNIWDGNNYGNLGGSDVVSHKKGGYTSNSLGAYVANNRIWYAVANNKNEPASQKKLYSSADGVNWRDEGEFKIDGKTDKTLDMSWNTNPMPVAFRGDVWVVSSNRKTGAPMVIKTSNGRDWTQVSNSTTKYTSPRYYSTMVSFNGKLWTIGGFSNGPDVSTSYNIWSSVNGKIWENIKPKDTKFVGPQDRYLAGGVVLNYKYSKKGGNLNVTAHNPAKVSFPKDVLVNENIGVWNLKAESPKDIVFDGKITITSIKIVGTQLANGNSSLRYMTNYKVYDESANIIGSTRSLKGPFYDSNQEPIPQVIKLAKPITLAVGQSARISLNADFALSPSFKDITTFLVPDFDFASDDTKACMIYSEHLESGAGKVPGKTLIKP